MTRRLLTLTALSAFATLAGAGSAHAAVTFGSDLSDTPVQDCGASGNDCSLSNRRLGSGLTPESGSPIAGVLTKIRIKYEGDGGNAVFRVLRAVGDESANQRQFLNVGPELAQTLPATNPAAELEFEVRHAIQAGDRLGLFANSTLMGLDKYLVGRGAGAMSCYLRHSAEAPHPADTTLPYDFSSCTSEVLMAGTVEPDGDGDGFGDESQDADDDNDGVPDLSDPFPSNPSEGADTDGDGVGDNADTDDDNDGLSDAVERARGTDPLKADSDDDGTPDNLDNCVLMPNFDQVDSDLDRVGDGCDADDDNDNLVDTAEIALKTNRLDVDSDDDGIGDRAERRTKPSNTDTDGDKLTDGLEAGLTRGIADPPGAVVGTDPRRFKKDRHPKSKTRAEDRDTDGDKLNDGREDRNKNGKRERNETDPRKRDTDGDRVPDRRDRRPTDRKRH